MLENNNLEKKIQILEGCQTTDLCWESSLKEIELSIPKKNLENQMKMSLQSLEIG